MHISTSTYLFSSSTVLATGRLGSSVILTIGLYFRE